MKLVEIALLSSLVLTTNGCTVLGLATDIALSSARAGDNNDNASQNELIFTNEGIKHDAKFIKQLVTDAINSNDNEPLFSKKAHTRTLMCENVQEGQQQCYPSEYYEDMYIKVESKNEQDTTTTEN